MKKMIIYIAAVLVLYLCSLCQAAQMLTVTDMALRTVTVPFNPERIVCIGPGTLRLIVYLRAETKLAGIEDIEKINLDGRPYTIAHPEFQKLPRCGPGGPAAINKKPDLEAILSVNPQIIFVTYIDASLADEVQNTLGIPVVVLSYGELSTFDEKIYQSLYLAGKILNRKARAKQVVAYINHVKKDLRTRTAGIPEKDKPGVYAGAIGYRGTHGIGSSQQSYIPFEWLGARNTARKVSAGISGHVSVNREMLLKINPDIVFVDGRGLMLVGEDFMRHPGYYNAMKAFNDRKVYALFPFNSYTTNLGSAMADAYAIGKVIYEARFEDIDLKKKADEIYAFLVGKPVYKKMREYYAPIGSLVPFIAK